MSPEEIIARMPIDYEVVYVGKTKKDDWECDAWHYNINNVEGDYYTGLSLRKDGEPVVPPLANVLHSLFLDSYATYMNFKEWCLNFGYSDDSIKALNIYMQCIDVGYNLRKMFEPEVYNQLKALLEEY